MSKFITGNFIDGSAIIYKKRNLMLVKGLLFQNGSIKWFDVLHFGNFCDGLAGIDYDGKFGYINREGEYVIEPKYMIGDDFSEGRAFVSNGGDTILIDTKGNEIRVFDEAFLTNQFSNGLARLIKVSSEGMPERMFYIDREGNTVVPASYIRTTEEALAMDSSEDDYSDGLFRAYVNDKYGFLDIDMNIVIPFDYDDASKFGDGLAAVYVNAGEKSRYGYINKNNEMVIPEIYDVAYRFNNGLAVVEKDDKMAIINTRNEVVFPFLYPQIYQKPGNVFKFKKEKDGKDGLMNSNFEILFPPDYQYIIDYDEGLMRFFDKNGREGVTDRPGNELISDIPLETKYYINNHN